MKNIKVIVTGAGAPGIQGTIYSLINNYDKRKIHIIGTDTNKFVVGKYICDEFSVISPAKETQHYLNDILNLCELKKVNTILPQNTAELSILAKNKNFLSNHGIKVAVSDFSAIENANNKFNLFQEAKNCGIPIAESYLVSHFQRLKEMAIKLGWPDKKFVVKPPTSNGSRGVRIISENYNRKEAFYQEKPTSLYCNLDELHTILGDEFPELIVMEYLPGDEYTVDVFRHGERCVSIPRKRISIRSGITFASSVEKNEILISQSNKLAEVLDLKYCFGFQFKINDKGEPMLLESNPRIQGTMVLSTLANANLIYSSIKALHDEKIPDFDIHWDTKMLRYWGAVGINDYGINKI